VLPGLKNIAAKKITLFLSLSLLSLATMAQDDTSDKSTVEPVDTTDHEAYYQPSEDGSATTTKNNYFLEKQVHDEGPDSFWARNLPDTVVRRLQTRDEFWYVNYPFEKEEEKANDADEPFIESDIFQALLWILIIAGFALFVAVYLSNSNIGLFRRSGKSIASEDGELQETDNIFEINYQRDIDKAISAGNYRLAVRLMFLRVLKNLSDKNIIQYRQDRTNFDYLMQMDATKYYQDFFRITREYEYCWYGRFDIEPEKFAVIKNDFENFGNNLNR
jgi:hypothetical protein